jgi:5-methylcytosine-specific restriction protein A
MPLAAGRPCSAPRCPNVVTKAEPCPTHSKYRAPRSEETAARDRFYHTARWLKFRRWFLGTDCETAGCQHAAPHALCQDCAGQGRTTAATDVDHITPRAEGGADLDARNARGLCKPCHSRRTRRAMNGDRGSNSLESEAMGARQALGGVLYGLGTGRNDRNEPEKGGNAAPVA